MSPLISFISSHSSSSSVSRSFFLSNTNCNVQRELDIGRGFRTFLCRSAYAPYGPAPKSPPNGNNSYKGCRAESPLFVVERNAPRYTMANVPKFQPARAWNRFCIVPSTLKVLSPERVPVALFFKWYQMQNRAKSVLARTGPPQAVPKSVKSVHQSTSNLRMPRVMPQSLFRSPCHHLLTQNVQHNDVKFDVESKSNDHKNELMEPPLEVDLPKVKHCRKTKRKLKKKLIKRAHQKQRLQQKLLAENIHKPLFHSLLKAMYFCNMMIVYKILHYILLHDFPCTSVDPNDCVQCPRFYCKTKPISIIKNHWHYTHYNSQQQHVHNCTSLQYKPQDTP